jgi:alkylated DNA nucleotide flippase Atl1
LLGRVGSCDPLVPVPLDMAIFDLGDDPSDFVEHVLEIVRAIPSGHVMTYGDVAAVLGSRGARAVGTVMARYGAGAPWWRVVRAGGLAPKGHEARARVHYLEEGTPLKGNSESYRIVMSSARYRIKP